MANRVHYLDKEAPIANAPVCGRGPAILPLRISDVWSEVTCRHCQLEQERRIQRDYNMDPDGDIEGADY